MATQYDDMAGEEQPVESHPDNSHSFKMAGEVTAISENPDYVLSGAYHRQASKVLQGDYSTIVQSKATGYALGRESDPSIKSIGMDTLSGWASRNAARRTGGGGNGPNLMPKY